MSDTQSIYKSVLGLNETGGTLFLIPYVQYRRETLAYPYNQQVRPDSYHFSPFKVATPIVSTSSTHPFDVKIVSLALPSISSTYRRTSYSEWV